VTLRQNNEPAGDQHAFHYHMHIFPRYVGDNFNANVIDKRRQTDPTERIVYAEKLLSMLKNE
jgi:histidine triad (HIT) family protein